MNRKYLRLRRFFGISAILLGVLIAILPVFTRAADIEAYITDERTDNSASGLIRVELSGTDADGATVSVLDGYEERWRLQEAGFTLAETDICKGYIFSVLKPLDLKMDKALITMPMPSDFHQAPEGLDYTVYVIYLLGNTQDAEVGKPTVMDTYTEGDFDVVTIDAGNELSESWMFVYVKHDPLSDPTPTAEETPTVSADTPTPTQSPTPTRRVTPTPTSGREPTNTPAPTSIPVRTPAIDDQRKDKGDTKGISSYVYGGSVPSSILIIRDSNGTGIKRIVVLRKGMRLKPWYIRLVDQDRRDIRDFSKIRITLPIPPDMDLRRGRVNMAGTGKDGKLQVFDTDIETVNGYTCAAFTIDYFSDFEYGMLYTPDGSEEEDNNLVIVDEREDKDGSVSANVTEGSGRRYLHIEDSDGEIIRRRMVIKDGMKLKPYRIWIEDEDGNRVNDFGSLNVTLPLPADFDPAKGQIRVVGSTVNNNIDDFVPEIIHNDDGTYSVRFATDYFSDNEYGIVYTPSAEKDEPTATPEPTPTVVITPTATPSPTPYAYMTNTPTPTAKGTPTATKAPDKVITSAPSAATVTPTATPTPIGGYNGGVGEGGDGGSNGGNGGAPGGGPIVTPKGRQFNENGLDMNYANTGKNGGSASNTGSAGSGVKKSNVKDMPKTGMADVPRILLVIILITFGCIEIITTIPFKKPSA